MLYGGTLSASLVALVLGLAVDASAQCSGSRWPRADGPDAAQRLHTLSRLFTALTLAPHLLREGAGLSLACHF